MCAVQSHCELAHTKVNNHPLSAWLTSCGYNDPAGGTFSQMRLHLAREATRRRDARISSTLASEHLTRLFMNASRRLIKRARNCEHASNVAREPDDRDIGTSFYAPRLSRGSERAGGRGKDSSVGNSRYTRRARERDPRRG